jgi:hypothetical protein
MVMMMMLMMVVMLVIMIIMVIVIVSDGKGLNQPACQKERKKCKKKEE